MFIMFSAEMTTSLSAQKRKLNISRVLHLQKKTLVILASLYPFVLKSAPSANNLCVILNCPKWLTQQPPLWDQTQQLHQEVQRLYCLLY